MGCSRIIGYQSPNSKITAAVTRCLRAPSFTLRLVVVHEIIRDIWPPGVEGVFRREVSCRPIAIGRHVVDVGGIFTEAAPRVLNVMKEVRAQHMTADTPALTKALA